MPVTPSTPSSTPTAPGRTASHKKTLLTEQVFHGLMFGVKEL
jgi:hypothetical protein